MAEAAERKPTTVVELIWKHDLVFAGTSSATRMTLDSDGIAGPSPVQALALGVLACMSTDVVHILRKGRHDLKGFRADLSGTRAATHPRRFTALTLTFTVNGDVPPDAVERAIQLSRDKYCSVWHSMRQDIELTITSSISRSATTV